MTFDLDIGMLVLVEPVYVKQVQGSRL